MSYILPTDHLVYAELTNSNGKAQIHIEVWMRNTPEFLPTHELFEYDNSVYYSRLSEYEFGCSF